MHCIVINRHLFGIYISAFIIFCVTDNIYICIYLLFIDNLSPETINHCMRLHHPGVMTVGCSVSVSESPEDLQSG